MQVSLRREALPPEKIGETRVKWYFGGYAPGRCAMQSGVGAQCLRGVQAQACFQACPAPEIDRIALLDYNSASSECGAAR